jgi:hypothetical protein
VVRRRQGGGAQLTLAFARILRTLSRRQTVLRLVFDESGAIGLVRWADSFELDVV